MNRKTLVRLLLPVAFAGGVVVLQPFAQNGMAELARFRSPRQTDCIGSRSSRLRIVYLHGRDSYGPSWGEIRNREVLRALSDRFDVRLALPRVRRGWPQDGEAELEESRNIIARAAEQCFDDASGYGIIGFSDGGNLANALYLDCASSSIEWTISVGSEGSGGLDRLLRPEACGRIAVVGGLHEPTYMLSRSFARQLQKRGADARFIEHDGVHELPFTALVDALEWVTR